MKFALTVCAILALVLSTVLYLSGDVQQATYFVALSVSLELSSGNFGPSREGAD